MKKFLLFAFISFVCCQTVAPVPSAPTPVASPPTPLDRLRILSFLTYPSATNARVVDIRSLSITKSAVSGVIDASDFVFDTLNQTTIYYSYFAAAAYLPNGINMAPTAAAAARFVSALRFFAVFEWEDHNGIPGFQDNSADIVLTVYDLSNPLLPWNPLNITTVTLMNTNNQPFKVLYITASTVDNVFVLRAAIAEQPVTIGNVRLTSDFIKIDVAIRYFNPYHVPGAWTPGPSNNVTHPNTSVAVIGVHAASFGAASFNADNTSNGNPSVVIGSNGFNGTFTWNNQASVTIQGITTSRVVYGAVQDTVASVNINAQFVVAYKIKIFILSYDGTRPDIVFHDPEYGAMIEYNQTDTPLTTAMTSKTGDASSFVFSFAILLIFLFISL